MGILKNKTTPKGKEFWNHVEKVAQGATTDTVNVRLASDIKVLEYLLSEALWLLEINGLKDTLPAQGYAWDTVVNKIRMALGRPAKKESVHEKH